MKRQKLNIFTKFITFVGELLKDEEKLLLYICLFPLGIRYTAATTRFTEHKEGEPRNCEYESWEHFPATEL